MEKNKCKECNMCIKTTHRTEDEKKNITKRLNIVEGQIRGIKQMIEDDRYCADILTQICAVNKALESVENTILESHIRNCVVRDIKNGDTKIIDEVMDLFKRIR